MANNSEDNEINTGAAEFKTVKAGCGIRFDPDDLDEESGFDFSQAEKLAQDSDEQQSLAEPKKTSP